jgi:hypothetical protein
MMNGNIDDVIVDSKLAKQSSLTAVSEILNGCMYVVGVQANIEC